MRFCSNGHSPLLVPHAVMVVCWGPVLLPFLLIGAQPSGWWQLTSANYVEHYGLLRQKDAAGRYQRCEPSGIRGNRQLQQGCRTWCWFICSGIPITMLIQTGPIKCCATMPTCRNCRSVIFPCSPWRCFTPLWFAVMDKRVVQWAEGDMHQVNIDPARVDGVVCARYHAPQDGGGHPPW